MEELMHYMCTTRDCNLKFDNEKQLTMHKRKHDMVLSLNKSNQCSSDETPTPTRFFRNCEAIGLFQDLQKVNPFEETFRQATEAVKKGQTLRVPSISSLEKSAGEDLHTPHIDLKEDSHISVDKLLHCEVERVSRSESSTSIKSCALSVPPTASPLIKENRAESKPENGDVRFFLKVSNGTLVEITSLSNNFEILKPNVAPNGTISTSTPTVGNDQKHLPTNQNNSAAVKKKLKEALLKAPKLKTVTHQHLSVDDLNINHENRKEKLVPTPVVEDKEEDRRRRSLERNRIAAMKCREKRKKWVTDLRDKYEKMCFTNQALVKEVVFLRKEVARLKGILITNNPPQSLDLSPTPTVNLISPAQSPKRSSSKADLEMSCTGPLRAPREGLRLDIEGASRATVMDLDSPLVRRDEILSSVAPPTTPNERLIAFTELDHESEVVEVSEERATTTVIQVNPNALTKGSLVFS